MGSQSGRSLLTSTFMVPGCRLCHPISPLQIPLSSEKCSLQFREACVTWVLPLGSHHGVPWVICWRATIHLLSRTLAIGWLINLCPKGARAIKIDSMPRNWAKYIDQPLYPRQQLQPDCSSGSLPALSIFLVENKITKWLSISFLHLRTPEITGSPCQLVHLLRPCSHPFFLLSWRKT